MKYCLQGSSWSILMGWNSEVMDDQLNLIIICNISTYVNNNNKCDPSGFSYIMVCFVPFVLFLPSIEPVLVSYCILLHDTGWRNFFSQNCLRHFLPWHMHDKDITMKALFSWIQFSSAHTTHSPAHHDQEMTQMTAAGFHLALTSQWT